MNGKNRSGSVDARRREFLKKAGQSALVLSAASFGQYGAFFPLSEAGATTAEAAGAVTVGIMAPSHCAAPYAYAHVKDLFAKQGVDVQLKYYQTC